MMMNQRDLIDAIGDLAKNIAEGDLNTINLTCPRCSYSPVTFSFAVNRAPRYGLYITCKNCNLFYHFNVGSKPANFRDDLILPEYQELENQAMLFSGNYNKNDMENIKGGKKR